MNTKHTGHSDGASEIAQEHRGTTNHAAADRGDENDGNEFDDQGTPLGRCELARTGSPRSAVRSRPRVPPAHPTARDVAQHALSRVDSMRPLLAA
jgi:hypothetical protein